MPYQIFGNSDSSASHRGACVDICPLRGLGHFERTIDKTGAHFLELARNRWRQKWPSPDHHRHFLNDVLRSCGGRFWRLGAKVVSTARCRSSWSAIDLLGKSPLANSFSGLSEVIFLCLKTYANIASRRFPSLFFRKGIRRFQIKSRMPSKDSERCLKPVNKASKKRSLPGSVK
jgi:hypothetical protein